MACALGVQHLETEQSLATFKDLSKQAFTKRRGVEMAGLRLLVGAHNHSAYETRGLVNALQGTFGSTPLFGVVDTSRFQTKVGVTTTSSNHNGYLMANYNRSEQDRCINFPIFSDIVAHC